MKRKLNWLTAVPTLCVLNVHAEDIKELDAYEVWGTLVEASSLNLSGDDITLRQADHISDLLRTIPGVDVGGAHSLNQRITIRSMDNKDLRITIDGANQNSYMYHHMGNLQIHADILKSVDINVGNNSVINGGLGGAVRFETKSADDLLRDGKNFGGRLQATYGDNHGKSYAATGFGKLSDQFDVLAYINFVDRDNYDVGGDTIRDGDGNVVPNTDGTVRGLEGELTDALIKLGWDITPNQRLVFGFENYQDEGDYSYRPDMGIATDLAIADNLGLPLTYPTEFTRDTFTLNYDFDWSDNSYLEATLYLNDSNLWRDESGVAAVFGPPSIIEGNARNLGFTLLANTYFDTQISHDLTYGFEYIDYDTELYNDGSFISGETSSQLAFYAEDRVGLGGGFSVIPGIRYEIYDIEANFVDKSFEEFTFGLQLEYAISDVWLFSLGTTKLFKGPEVSEVFIGAGANDSVNQEIEAETGYNTELRMAFSDKILGADQFRAGLTLFRTDIDNYIYDYATPPPSVGGRSWKDNVGDLEIEGIEAYVGYEIGDLNFLLTYSDAESELAAFEEYVQYDGARIDRQQGNTFSLNIDYSIPRYDLKFNWNTVHVDDVPNGPDLDGATLNNSKAGYVVHNLSANWSPKSVDGLSATFGVDNLFDEYYASQSSRTGTSFHPRFGELYLLDYEPGRNIKLTLAYQF